MNSRPMFFLLGAFILLFFTFQVNAKERTYTIYFQSDRDGQVGIYRLDGTEAVLVAGPGTQHPSVTKDDSCLYYTKLVETSWGKFWNIFYLKEGKEHRLTTNEIYDEMEPTVSKDGKWVCFTTMRLENLEIITLPVLLEDRNELQYEITKNQKPDEQPSLSSGKAFVYWTGRTGNFSYIFRAPANGGEAQRISTEAKAWEEHPSVSSDNRYIAYVAVTKEEPESTSTENKASEETTTSASPGEESPKTTTNVPTQDMDKPDAARGNYDIWVLDQVTNTRVRLTTEKSWEGNPCISSDGEKIVFTSDRDGNLEIYIINRDGSNLKRLTENDSIDDFATIT